MSVSLAPAVIKINDFGVCSEIRCKPSPPPAHSGRRLIARTDVPPACDPTSVEIYRSSIESFFEYTVERIEPSSEPVSKPNGSADDVPEE